MVKKSKESSKKPENNPNIFSKLFGESEINQEIPQSDEINSIFSSENPFRRKPIENPQIVSNPNPKEQVIEKNPNSSSPETLKKTPKSKEHKSTKKPNSVSENVEIDEKKSKKKRKRDELEKKYEAKKYGVVEGENVGVEKDNEKVKVGKKRKSVDNPAETMVVSKEEAEAEGEGYDDESKLLRTVFVGNLPLKVKKKNLIKEFTPFGEIVSVRIRSVPTLDSKKPKKALIFHGKLNEAADSVHAYIVFKTEEEAEASLAHNMSVVGGNHIRVDRACPPRKKLKGETDSATLYSSKRTVFVGNLPFDAKDEELYQLFCGIKELESSVEAVRVIRDRATSLGKGIAYVMFKTREAANLVCKKRKLKLRDRELRISHAKSESQLTPSKKEEDTSTPSKRKGDFPVNSESTPVKKFSAGGMNRHGRYKINTLGDTSYQGFHATKAGDKTRTPSRNFTPAPFKGGIKKGDNVKQRTEKRPSVEARKKKTLAAAMKGVSLSKQGGNKRKMDARTPQSSNQKKKFRKS